MELNLFGFNVSGSSSNDKTLSFFQVFAAIIKYRDTLGQLRIGSVWGIVLLSIALFAIPVILMILLLKKHPKIDLLLVIGGVVSIILLFVFSSAAINVLSNVLSVTIGKTFMFYVLLLVCVGITAIGVSNTLQKKG